MPLFTEEELAMIDRSTWGRNTDTTNPEALTSQMLNGHLLYYIRCFKKQRWEDELGWELFTTAFVGWTKELFERAKLDLVIDLREQLRQHGVFIAKDGKSIAENMAAAANSEEYHEWTDAELDETQDFLADLQNEDHEPCKEQFSTEIGKVDGNQTLTYLGPPEHIVHDAGKNFISTEFKQNAKSLTIEVKEEEVPVEAFDSVGKVERYHADLPGSTAHEAVLQMAVKTVTDTAGPDGLVPTLPVFGAYPRMSNNSLPSLTVTQRAEAVPKAMNEVRRLHAEHQVKDALAMRNDSNTMETLDLPSNSNVRVWREKENWIRPFKLISTNGETCTVQMPHKATNFRSTVVKPYYTEPSSPQSPVRRRRGRLKYSKNKPKQTLHMFSEDGKEDFDDCFVAALTGGTELTMTFMTSREEVDRLLALKLRQEQKITTPARHLSCLTRRKLTPLLATVSSVLSGLTLLLMATPVSSNQVWSEKSKTKAKQPFLLSPLQSNEPANGQFWH